jgi:aminobenzoyl-glutamate transport protein
MREFFQGFVSTYSGFAALGLVLIMMIGIGLLEQTGMLSSLMRATILGAPEAYIIAVIAFVGVNANLASDAGVVVVPAVAGAIFKSLGRNPWIGVIAGYCAANGGFGANMLIAGTDALLAGITESVTKGLGIDAPVHPLMNWYFMFTASVIIIVATVIVTRFFTEKYLGDDKTQIDSSLIEKHKLTEDERKGLRASGIAALVFIGIVLLLTVPKDALFRAADGSILPRSPLLSSVVSILFLFFFTVGMAYGKASGTIKTMKDVPQFMQKGVAGALSFIVIALPASLFIDLLSKSNITVVVGVHAGNFLKEMNIQGFPLLLAFILISITMNIFITSGSAKWLILSPLFIPLFSILGYSPALTQIAYRIGDSCTNIISPVDYYVPVIMGLLETYKTDANREVGIGTVISLCLPYSIAYFIGFVILLFVWFTLRLPLGPGVPSFM